MQILLFAWVNNVTMWRSTLILLLLLISAPYAMSQGESDLISSNQRPPLQSSKIAVIYGSNYEAYAESTYPDAELYRLDFFADILELLGRGSADYAIYNISTLEYITEHDKRFEIVDNSLFDSQIGFGFNPENVALRDEMNEFLDWFLKSEEYADIVDRWSKYSDGGDIPHIEILEEGRDLVAGICGVLPPFSLIKNNVIEGFDVEILKHFALHNGYRFRYFSVSLNYVINALHSNFVDVAGAGMAIVDERKGNIIFSNPYGGLQAGVLARSHNYDAADVPSLWSRIRQSLHTNIIEERRYGSIFQGIYNTLSVSIFSLFFGTLLGLAMILLIHFGGGAVSHIVKAYMAIINGIPLYLLLLICFYVIFVGSGLIPLVVCVITFSLHFSVSVCKMLDTAISGVNIWAIEAARSMGFSPWGVFIHITAPQAIAQVLPLYKNISVRLIKLTSIVGCTSLRDLTKVGNDIRCRTFDAFTPLILTAILYILLSYLTTKLFDYIIHHTRFGGRHLRVRKWSRIKHRIFTLHHRDLRQDGGRKED